MAGIITHAFAPVRSEIIGLMDFERRYERWLRTLNGQLAGNDIIVTRHAYGIGCINIVRTQRFMMGNGRSPRFEI